MNFNNYTQKSIEAVQSAQQLAVQNSHQQMEQVHLLLALLRQEGGLIPQLLKKMDVTVEKPGSGGRSELRKIPGVRTSQAMDSFYVSADVQAAFNAAEQQAQTMKDEYVSVEHLFLGLLETARGGVKELFKTYQITRERVLKACRKSAAISVSPPITRREPTTRWKSTALTWSSGQESRRWIR